MANIKVHYNINDMNAAIHHFHHRQRKSIMHRSALSLTGRLLALVLLFTACKKEKEDAEELPVFGTCQAVATKGHLSYTNPAGPYTFKTNGGGKIEINEIGNITITHDSYPGFSIGLWGGDINPQGKASASHESFNGKHIKDRHGARRTILFPDGAKMTIVASGESTPMISISIYDGKEFHRINPACNTVEYSSDNATFVKQLDDAEADGETGAIEFSAASALFVNTYTEATAGNKVMNRVQLAGAPLSQLNNVTDYYDDPRLQHT